jgi:hypothetical protein
LTQLDHEIKRWWLGGGGCTQCFAAPDNTRPRFVHGIAYERSAGGVDGAVVAIVFVFFFFIIVARINASSTDWLKKMQHVVLVRQVLLCDVRLPFNFFPSGANVVLDEINDVKCDGKEEKEDGELDSNFSNPEECGVEFDSGEMVELGREVIEIHVDVHGECE